jgi:hypothetical protein
MVFGHLEYFKLEKLEKQWVQEVIFPAVVIGPSPSTPEKRSIVFEDRGMPRGS